MSNKRVSRPLLWALLLSLLAHLLLIGRVSGWAWPSIDSPAIEVELVAMPMPVAAVMPPATKPAPVVAQPKPMPAPPPAPVAAPSPVPEVTESSPAVETLSAPQAPVPMPVTDDRPPPVVEAPELPPVVEQEEAPTPTPRQVDIEYRILRKGGVAGVEKHSYRVVDSRYILKSVAEPKGLLSLALSELVQESSGQVTPQGLKPQRFTYQYGNKADKAQRAVFDWQAGKLQLQTAKRTQEVPLNEGAQDLMSFMYQFMFVPPLQEMQLAITNGKRLKTYDYGFDGQEVVETPFGKVECLHIEHNSTDGEEKTELWLAADYHYLPIKITRTEKDGTVLERVATRLQIE